MKITLEEKRVERKSNRAVIGIIFFQRFSLFNQTTVDQPNSSFLSHESE